MDGTTLALGMILAALVGSIVTSALGAVGGWRMRRFRKAQRIARKLGKAGGTPNPRDRH
ncbi:MAG: hypothetical protein KDA73_01935 [Rhodobacteraceae bacterium]|nr:hypothetical protein [Paracoccaceae bacterium]